jgi:hypothetical protein
MIILAIYTQHTFKERLLAISEHAHSRTANLGVRAIQILSPRFTSIDSMRHSVDRLDPRHRSISVEVRNRRTFRKNIMIRLQFYLELALERGKRQVERLQGADAVGGRVDAHILDSGDGCERVASLRMGERERGEDE